MQKIFIINYEVDTGYDYIRDNAIVRAENEECAKTLLKSKIRSIGNDYFVTKIFSIEPFIHNIFSARYGLK